MQETHGRLARRRGECWTGLGVALGLGWLALGGVGAATVAATSPAPARELIRDSEFRGGFIVLDPAPGRRVEVGRLLPKGAGASEPAWDLAQWSSRFPLAGEPARPAPGVSRWSNDGKAVTLGPGGAAGADLALKVLADREYGGRARRSGEPWVHLLVQQEFSDPPALGALTNVWLHLEARLLSLELHRTAEHTPSLHAAQFQMFLTLQNRRQGSPEFGQLVWFGIPLFDDRSRVPPEHKQQDTGGTGMFIYTPGGSVYTAQSAHDREWITVDRELRPLLVEALASAWDRGFLRASRDLADYRITGMNLGWEVPGLFDVEMAVRRLSLRVR